MTKIFILAKDRGAGIRKFAAGKCFAAAVAGCVTLASALAADPKPDAAFKNRNIDGAVFLDAKIKADPALAADCLGEGKKWIGKNAADAESSREQDPVMFRNGAWSFERKYEVRSVVDGHYVSIVRSDYMDTGGAHPIRTSTPSCGTQPRSSASASGPSSPRPPTTARPCVRC
jgi:hypothetical protein